MGNTNNVPRSRNTDLENPENHNHDLPSTNPNNIEEEASNTTCEICIEPMLSNNKFKNQNKCVHPFCTDCVAKYINVQVKCHASADVKCPGSNCNEVLDPLSCKTLISQNLFDKWCDNLCTSAIEEVDKCYCPRPTCSTLILNECGVIQGSSICPNCKGLFCFKCKMPWHADYRCAESGTVRDRNDVLFGKLSERLKWARCPGCGHCVERTSGCLIITCRCRTKFCYNCGEKRIEVHGCPVCQSSEARPPPVPEGYVQPAGAGGGRGGAVVIFCFILLLLVLLFITASHEST